jgi:hypothetical protein
MLREETTIGFKKRSDVCRQSVDGLIGNQPLAVSAPALSALRKHYE